MFRNLLTGCKDDSKSDFEKTQSRIESRYCWLLGDTDEQRHAHDMCLQWTIIIALVLRVPTTAEQQVTKHNIIIMASSTSSMYADMMNGIRMLGKSESTLPHEGDTSRLVKTPAGAVREALSNVEVPSYLYQGIPIVKVTSAGVHQHRILTLSSDHLAFFITHKKVRSSGGKIVASIANNLPIPLWTPSKGFRFRNDVAPQHRYIRHLDVGDIDVLVEEVVSQGQQLEALNVRKRREEIGLTLFHHGMSNSLNLLIKNPEHHRAVVSVLNEMKLKYHQVIRFVSPTSLLLRYVWYYIDQDRSGNISSKEFKHICDMINLQVNAQEYFDKAKHEDKLTYEECARLLVEIRNDLSPVLESWTALFGDAIQGMISPHRILTDFLYELQGETSTTIDDAQVSFSK